jgi:integrase
MSVYLIKGKGWRYDFTLEGIRHTEAWFKTKTEARQAEATRREELKNPKPEPATPTDMDFLTMVNKRLDHVKNYDSASHFRSVLYHSRRWIKEWNGLTCKEISSEMIENHIIKRLQVSACVANKEIEQLRALFNFGIKRKIIDTNPTENIDFFPVEKRKKYIPSKEDVLKVISSADPETQQYLWTILLTAGRVGEINGLTWDDVNFSDCYVTLWTRKRKGGNREPRDVPMITKLRDILKFRYEKRNLEMPWVFWHTYWSRKYNKWIQGPYGDRKKIMKTLCTEAKVKYFRFHPLRHLTASILDDLGTPIGVIQRILGHQNRRTTEIYLHSVGEAERDAMNRLEGLDLFSADISLNQHTPTNMHNEYWHRKVDRPPYKALKKEVENLGYSGTGKKYGVSDNSVRKWLKSYENRSEILN